MTVTEVEFVSGVQVLVVSVHWYVAFTPLWLSEGESVNCRSSLCQSVLASSVVLGAVRSILTYAVLVSSMFPIESRELKSMAVMPLAVTRKGEE